MRNMDTKQGNEDGNTSWKNKGTSLGKCKDFVMDHKTLVVLVCLIIVAVVIGISLGLALPAKEQREDTYIQRVRKEFRLPTSVIPSHYVLEVQPYLVPDNFKFDGTVQISITCIEETDSVIFHSVDLRIIIENVRLRSILTGSNLKIRGVTFNESNDFVIIDLYENLKANNDYLLIIKYNGMMNLATEGLYVSTYNDDQGTTHYTASTQLEPIHARNVFPCFDEPAFKATFDIIIVRWRNMTSLSNMPRIKVERREDDWEADTYATSMKMSTYLVAFVVGKYVGKTEDKLTIWAPKGIEGSVDFALDLSLKLLDFFEKILDVPYEAPKLDMAAVTKHVANAMENWGLVIFQDSSLLLNINSNDTETQKLISMTVAHELAHQWFGNLVTPKWWSDIWLSEGVTTYLEQIASRYFFPKWYEIDEALVIGRNTIFPSDCEGEHTSTVWKNVTDKYSIVSADMFNSIVYNKGALIVRMVHYLLGNETFSKMLSKYLKENAYGNVDESDFWRYVNEAYSQTNNAKIDMEKMKTWTHLPGVPIVSVIRNYKENKATLLQTSCRKNRSDLWTIPISYSSKRNAGWNPSITGWLTGENKTLSNMPGPEEWILFNGQSVGYCIVNYDKQNWKLLANQLKTNHEVFTPEQRFNILGDANSLHRMEHSTVTTDILLDLYVYLHNEKVLSIFVKQGHTFITNSLSLMKLSPLNKEWKEFIIHILGPSYEKLSWNTEEYGDSNIQLFSDHLVYSFCDLNYEPCVQEALKRFEIWKAGTGTEMMKEERLLQLVLCTAARSENNSYSNLMYEMYAIDKSLGDALLCCSNVTIIKRILQVHYQTKTFFKSAYILADNVKSWPVLFEFFDKHFEEYANNQRTFSRLMMLLVHDFRNSPLLLEKAVRIAKRHIQNVAGKRGEVLQRWIIKTEETIPKMILNMDFIEKWLKHKSWRM